MTSAPASPEVPWPLDTAPCGLMQTTDDGAILRVNLTFSRWIGAPAEALVGHARFQDLLTMGGRIFHQTHWVPLLRMQGSVSEVKMELRYRESPPVPMILNAIRHEVEGRIVIEIAAYVARDRDRYERELLQARRRQDAAVAEVTQLHAEARDRAYFAEQMVGIVSHDLRNPLTTILMGTALLAEGDLSPGQQRITGQITRAAERANRLISDLLDFTQASVGKGLPMAPALIDLHDVVAEALDELRMAQPGRALLHEHLGDRRCVADPARLAQALGNLVSNAIAYGAPDRPVRVRTSTDEMTWTLEVHNAGAPIPPEVQARLFEPMTRGTKAGSKARSIGLGLFIVREIARAHRGDARVSSTADGGTTFRLELPRLVPDDATAP